MTPVEIRAAINADPAILALVPDTQAVADALSAGRLVTGKVSAHDIRQYLMLVDLLIPIESTPVASCIAATRALDVFPIFDLSNIMILGKFTQVLDALVAEELIPDFTETHKATILSLAQTPAPVSEWEVRVAIVNDDGSIEL